MVWTVFYYFLISLFVINYYLLLLLYSSGSSTVQPQYPLNLRNSYWSPWKFWADEAVRTLHPLRRVQGCTQKPSVTHD